LRADWCDEHSLGLCKRKASDGGFDRDAPPPKLDQDGLTKAREKALTEAEALTDPEERRRAIAEVSIH